MGLDIISCSISTNIWAVITFAVPESGVRHVIDCAMWPGSYAVSYEKHYLSMRLGYL